MNRSNKKRRWLLPGLLVLGVLASVAAAGTAHAWLMNPVTPVAHEVRDLFYKAVVVTSFFFLIAELLLLVQGRVGDICSGWMLVGQPIRVTQEWSEQTITAVLDAQQWKCLGTRPDRADMYGTIALESILRNVNVNLYLVTYPVNAVPMGPVDGDPQRLRAGRDYPLWQCKLPEGYVMLDTFRVEFE